jgi:hypothetical protein
LYEAFAPEEARRLVEKLEFHYTAKHGSWLNMAEIKLSVLARQCLHRRIPDAQTFRRIPDAQTFRRIPDAQTLQQEGAAWHQGRNQQQVTIRWCFKVADARTMLKRLFPSLS